jgi:hypothetical protein
MCLCFQPGQPINWVLPCRPKQYNREAIAACFPTFPGEILPNWFSCDWLSWSSAHFFFIPYYWHNISVAEATITRLFKLPGKLRPLAFMEGADIIVLVAAGKEYALWDAVNEDLTRFGWDFASDEAFLARFHGLYWNEMKRIGMVVARPRNHRAIYKKIGMEQAELVRTVEGRIAFDANGIAQSVSPTYATVSSVDHPN